MAINTEIDREKVSVNFVFYILIVIFALYSDNRVQTFEFYSVFAIVLALRNCQFQTQQDNRHERLRYSVGGVYMLCGYGSTFKAYDLPTLYFLMDNKFTMYNHNIKKL